MTSDDMPAIIEIKLISGVNQVDTVAVAVQALDSGDRAATVAMSQALARIAVAAPAEWKMFRPMLQGAVATLYRATLDAATHAEEED